MYGRYVLAALAGAVAAIFTVTPLAMRAARADAVALEAEADADADTLTGTLLTGRPLTIRARLNFPAADENLARHIVFHNAVRGWHVIDARPCYWRNAVVLVLSAESLATRVPADTSFWSEPCFLAGPWGDSLDTSRLARFRAAWNYRNELLAEVR